MKMPPSLQGSTGPCGTFLAEPSLPGHTIKMFPDWVDARIVKVCLLTVTCHLRVKSCTKFRAPMFDNLCLLMPDVNDRCRRLASAGASLVAAVCSLDVN